LPPVSVVRETYPAYNGSQYHRHHQPSRHRKQQQQQQLMQSPRSNTQDSLASLIWTNGAAQRGYPNYDTAHHGVMR